ncbi:hypothetical protein KSS87_020772 [Heliosperma pusillum]|nr:hypothetical protein KSS87_020772 [Heliosperma pusillum]
MAVRGSILAAAFFASFVAVCYGEEIALFSQLPRSLIVTTDPAKVDLKAGVGKITVTWELNTTSAADTTKYSTVAIKLCYRKESQIDRPWRKTENELFKDKTCPHDITKKNYTATLTSTDYIVKKEIPTAHYFIRAYVLDAAGKKVAYGQTIPDVDLSITAITGRHASIDIAAAVFSAFSVLSLGFFFYLEKKKAKRDT